MKTRLSLTYLIGLSLLALLFVVATPYFAARIPAALETSTREKLHANGINWARVETSGRDIIISGVAPNPPNYQQALQLPESIAGVRNVVNHMQKRLISPYTMNLNWDGQQLKAEGFLPDEASYRQIGQLVTQTYGGEAEGKLQLASGEPAGWSKLLETLLPNLRQLERAHVNITDQQIDIAGKTASSVIRDQFTQSLEGFREQGYTLDLHIVATDAAAMICQQKFNELLKTPISFDSGQATIRHESYSLLENLAETAMLCPDAQITIAGHTDNEGDALTNTKLSQQRARAVAGWLFQQGISTDRIKTIGYGERKPVASNDTEAGRAQNRRIEFIVQGS